MLVDPEGRLEQKSHWDKTAHAFLAGLPVAAAAARDLLNKAENERSGVVSTAVSFLTLYRDPLVARATSASDFRIADLASGSEPVSLYLVVPLSDLKVDYRACRTGRHEASRS